MKKEDIKKLILKRIDELTRDIERFKEATKKEDNAVMLDYYAERVYCLIEARYELQTIISLFN